MFSTIKIIAGLICSSAYAYPTRQDINYSTTEDNGSLLSYLLLLLLISVISYLGILIKTCLEYKKQKHHWPGFKEISTHVRVQTEGFAGLMFIMTIICTPVALIGLSFLAPVFWLIHALIPSIVIPAYGLALMMYVSLFIAIIIAVYQASKGLKKYTVPPSFKSVSANVQK